MCALNASDQVIIGVKMVDSESFVKAEPVTHGVGDSESLTRKLAKLANVPAKRRNRDTVLSDYVRHRINEWVRTGREQKELAQVAGFKSPSTVAMVKTGQGVGAASVPGFAKAFQFATVEAMVDAAYEWRKGLGESLDRRLADEAFMQGVALVGSAMPPPTEAEVRTIAADFVGPRFDKRDAVWWFNTVGTELKRDRDRIHAEVVEKKTARLEKARSERAEEGRWRADARRKHDVADAAEETLRREQAAAAEVENKKRRRKIRAL